MCWVEEVDNIYRVGCVETNQKAISAVKGREGNIIQHSSNDYTEEGPH